MCSQEGEGYSLLKEYANAFMVSQVLFAACELGVFELLAEALEPLDSAAVSSHLGSSPGDRAATEHLCVPEAAASRREGRKSCVCKHGARQHLPGERQPQVPAGHAAVRGQDRLRLLAPPGEAVREGRNQYLKAFGIPSEELFSAIYRSEDERLQFMQGLQDVWRLEGATVLAAFDLSPFPLICDLGGGSGALAKACVSLYPGCRAIVFDI
ncbi:TPA: hydroxyindole O-methyltransferase, partial [Bos taurus]